MIIFDFDGTIADSLPTLLECLNNNAAYYGYKKINDPDMFRDKNMQEVMRELGITFLKLPLVVRAIRKEIGLKITHIKTFPGMEQVLKQLHEQGISLGILTSNSQENVKIFLQANNMDFFNIVYGNSRIFGKGKILGNLIKKYNLDTSTIYVGDETRDIEAAKENNIRCIGVTWGYNTAQALQEKKPDYIIAKPEELLEVVKKLNF